MPALVGIASFFLRLGSGFKRREKPAS